MSSKKVLRCLLGASCFWVGLAWVVPKPVARLGIGGDGQVVSGYSEVSARAQEGFMLGLKRSYQRKLVGLPVMGYPGRIRSPYVTDGPVIEVNGLLPGSEAVCPTTGRALTIPSFAAQTAVSVRVRWFEELAVPPGVGPMAPPPTIDLSLEGGDANGFINYGSVEGSAEDVGDE